tara:strand:+ start:12811 stop:13419 length:609 start_codon:yes stop_codon:yes gene_type:complete
MAYLAGMSDVKIANLALSHLGVSATIQSFAERSTEASVTNLWYDFARLQVLETHDWSFARKVVTLAAHSDAPSGLWTYRYQRPADCVVVRTVLNPFGRLADAIPFALENSDNGETETLLTDLNEAQIRYTFNATAPSLFSAAFITSLSYLLAHYSAMSLTNSEALQNSMLQRFLGSQRQAAAMNANEAVGDEPRDAEWIRSR